MAGAFINWAPQWQEAYDTVVWVDVSKADRAWSRDPDYYIPEGGTGSEHKYRKVGEWLQAEPRRTVWMPHVSLWRYTLHFTDGRHRFGWLRDHGLGTLPVTIAPSQAERLQRWLGAK
jgi:hypothetical protein